MTPVPIQPTLVLPGSALVTEMAAPLGNRFSLGERQEEVFSEDGFVIRPDGLQNRPTHRC